MCYHERIWRSNLYITGCSILLSLLLLALRTPSNVVLSSFGILGFAVFPLLFYRKKLKEERDEMIREIERRAKTLSLRVTFIFLFLVLWFIFILHSNAEVVKISSLLLVTILWLTLLLLLVIQSVVGLYYLKKGIKSEN